MPRYTPQNCPHCEYDRKFPGFEMGGWMQQDNNGPIVSCPLCNDDGAHPSKSYREGWNDVMEGLRPRKRRRTGESITEFASYLKGVSEAQAKKEQELRGTDLGE